MEVLVKYCKHQIKGTQDILDMRELFKEDGDELTIHLYKIMYGFNNVIKLINKVSEEGTVDICRLLSILFKEVSEDEEGNIIDGEKNAYSLVIMFIESEFPKEFKEYVKQVELHNKIGKSLVSVVDILKAKN